MEYNQPHPVTTTCTNTRLPVCCPVCASAELISPSHPVTVALACLGDNLEGISGGVWKLSGPGRAGEGKVPTGEQIV